MRGTRIIFSYAGGVGYLRRPPDAIPTGLILIHNDVWPVARRLGTRGSRAWLDEENPGYEVEPCDCDWAPELGAHYRTRRK